MNRNRELIDTVTEEISHLQQRLFTQRRNITELRSELDEESRKLRLATIGAEHGDVGDEDDYSAASGSLADQQRELDDQLNMRRRELERDMSELQEVLEKDKAQLEQSRLIHMQEIAKRREEMAVGLCLTEQLCLIIP